MTSPGMPQAQGVRAVLSPVDPINEFVDRLYLPNWKSTALNFSSDWGLSVPAGVVSMYVLSQGSGWLLLDDATEPLRVIAGDHIIVTSGCQHRIQRDQTSSSEPIDEWLETPLWPIPPQQSTEILYGQFDLCKLDQNPLRVGVPDVIHMNHRRDRELQSCTNLLDAVSADWRDVNSGCQLMMRRIGELIFRKTFASALARIAASDSGELNLWQMEAITDPLIGPVLKALEDNPGHPWTVPGMGKMVGASKSTFSERFRCVVGSSPLQYLTDIRMRSACYLLRESEIEIANIATMVGYVSSSSFSNAFKRHRGCSPADYRKD